MGSTQDILTTGQVAKICNVAPRTVSKWFDNGQLRGYRIPGSKDRRIPVDQLIRFMKAHGMPLNGLDGHQRRILIFDQDEEFAELLKRTVQQRAGYEVESVHCVFEAGAVAAKLRPHVILADVSSAGFNAQQFCRFLRNSDDLRGTKLIAVSKDMNPALGQEYISRGFDRFLQKPFSVQTLIEALEGVAPSTN